MNRITRLSGLLVVVAACGARGTVVDPAENEDAAADASSGEAVCPPTLVDGGLYAGQTLDGGYIQTWSQVVDIGSWCSQNMEFTELSVSYIYNAAIVDHETFYTEYDFDIGSGRLRRVMTHAYDNGWSCTIGVFSPPWIPDDFYTCFVTSCDALTLQECLNPTSDQ